LGLAAFDVLAVVKIGSKRLCTRLLDTPVRRSAAMNGK
jgi:hypothetical protein